MRDEQLDQELESALQAFPQEPLPERFVENVLAEVAETAQVQLVPRFQLQLFDFAVPTFVAGLFALIISLARGIIRWQPQEAIVLQFANEWYQFSPELVGLLPPLIVAELLGMALFCWWLWGERPFPFVETAAD